MNLSCASCRWSMDSIEGLYCGKSDKEAVKVCRFFSYEPGTDQSERKKEGKE